MYQTIVDTITPAAAEILAKLVLEGQAVLKTSSGGYTIVMIENEAIRAFDFFEDERTLSESGIILESSAGCLIDVCHHEGGDFTFIDAYTPTTDVDEAVAAK